MKTTGYEIAEYSNGDYVANRLYTSGFWIFTQRSSEELGVFQTENQARQAIDADIKTRKTVEVVKATRFGPKGIEVS